jgi:hypothetical protein
MKQKHKTLKLTISLDLLCTIWDSREDPNDNLDTAIEKLVIAGLKAEGRIPQCP